ncbi:MAG: hypothetical protein H0U27_10990 [Nitrosopumilus sp.]|jgi:hypothetical protein|nr:hypothetical protein [Nitrosopumilus sp.]
MDNGLLLNLLANIDAVTNIARVKAKEYYGEYKGVDVEAAMLSNHCTSVKEYVAKQNKIRNTKYPNYISIILMVRGIKAEKATIANQLQL